MKKQLYFSLQPRHYSSLNAPNFQTRANQDMYNFRFTTPSNTNNASNYQSTNETHHTQQNTTITTHNRTLRSPHTREHYDHHTQQNTTITTHNRTLRSPHTTEHYDHHTQQNTTITTHKGSQLLKLIQTRYQLQSSYKELHIEHTHH